MPQADCCGTGGLGEERWCFSSSDLMESIIARRTMSLDERYSASATLVRRSLRDVGTLNATKSFFILWCLFLFW